MSPENTGFNNHSVINIPNLKHKKIIKNLKMKNILISYKFYGKNIVKKLKRFNTAFCVGNRDTYLCRSAKLCIVRISFRYR